MFEIKQEPKKDMKTVHDYNKRQDVKIFRGQCFNNACVLLTSFNREGTFISDIFDFAEQLYDEGIKRNWLKFEEVKK